MKRGFHVVIVGPLAPPAGGMATQTRQLRDLLSGEGVSVEILRTNPPYRPGFVAELRGIRAVFRFLPYLTNLWRAAGRGSVFHVMANSGWAWHLFAAPAIRIGRLRGVRVVVNYRGGAASEFLARAGRKVKRTLRGADAVVVPSAYLERVFAEHGVPTTIVPNIVDVGRFSPLERSKLSVGDRRTAHVVIARNLEPIYDIATGLRAFALLQARFPLARLTVAGSGPAATMLKRLAAELGIGGAVRFPGMLSREEMIDLYRSATLLCNPSLVDNTPNSILEAMACGIPVVSTNVGGIPDLVQDGVTALLVPPADPAALERGMSRLLDDEELARKLVDNGLHLARGCAWQAVYPLWMRAYRGQEDAHCRCVRLQQHEEAHL